MSETFYTPQQLAERWSVTTGWLANSRYIGLGVPFMKIGTHLVRYRLSAIEEYEQSREVETIPLAAI